ncbi:high frequency lysogenization protein HflD [Leptolyngbya sp. 'hensonii']|uniref:nickel/cobalt transporter n=1 Tax=Leptolyngbya sp. 'hensonii' TaxID=1922337 RepID=UPI0009501494|nr:sulfite exporter TauE/SafE family protein [Leptolyngbya sp. 'hensonii']OLP19206.1 high frequency lysogenization protein HflD [Leptolyngbya sp. 'hensonii']
MQQLPILAHLDHASRLTGLLESPPSFGTISAGIAIAFGVGAIHALAPGHGKTMISAYLVGARGTPQHAILLGLVTTITHTLTIFLLGLGVLFASQYVIPDQLYPVLSVISGLTVCGVGVRLLQRRLNSEADHCSHHHHHEVGSAHHHEPSSDPSADTSMASLVSLGIAGGMVPCPSALVLLLSAIALHQTTYGLFLVSGFSAGMASVLVFVGLLVLYAKQWLDQFAAPEQLGRQLSIVSAIVIMCAGIGLTMFSIV